MKDYELTALFAGNLEEKKLDHEVKNLQTILEKAGAKIKSKNDPEKKVLTYEIKHNREAYYVYMELTMEPSAAVAIEEKLRVADTVIRYLLVNKGE